MIKNVFLLFLISTLCFSCYYENKDPIEMPDPLLSHDQMVDILTDVQIAEGILGVNRMSKLGDQELLKDSVYKTILSHYGISGEDLQANINYYNIKPENMERIYEDVLTNLSKAQSELSIEAAKRAEEEKDITKKETITEED